VTLSRQKRLQSVRRQQELLVFQESVKMAQFQHIATFPVARHSGTLFRCLETCHSKKIKNIHDHANLSTKSLWCYAESLLCSTSSQFWLSGTPAPFCGVLMTLPVHFTMQDGRFPSKFLGSKVLVIVSHLLIFSSKHLGCFRILHGVLVVKNVVKMNQCVVYF